MLNVRFPLNFASPYQAANIAEFWRRWHITLSRFLRDYVYIPLGGNRHGEVAAQSQPDGDDAARRPVARRGVELRAVGRAAWVVSGRARPVPAGSFLRLSAAR